MTDRSRDLQSLCAEYGLLAVYAFGPNASEIAAQASEASPVGRRAAFAATVGVEPVRGHDVRDEDRVVLADRLRMSLGASVVHLVVLPEADAFVAADAVRGELLVTTDPDAEAGAQLYYLRCAADLIESRRRMMEVDP